MASGHQALKPHLYLSHNSRTQQKHTSCRSLNCKNQEDAGTSDHQKVHNTMRSSLFLSPEFPERLNNEITILGDSSPNHVLLSQKGKHERLCAKSDNRHSPGSLCTAKSDNRHSPGSLCTAKSDNRHSPGSLCTAKSDNRHSPGSLCTAKSDNRHSPGSLCTAKQSRTH